MVGLGDEHRLEAARAVAVGPEDLQLVHPLHVEPSEAFEPLISHWKALRRPSASRVASIVPIGAALELDRGLERIVDPPAREERVDEARRRSRSRRRGTAQVDDVGAEVAERAGAGLVRLEAPGVEARVVAPVLQVAAAEVADLAELAGLDQLARQPHRRARSGS